MLNRQRGMSLLEIMAAIAVGTVLFIGLTDMIDVSLEDAKGQQAAYHQAQVTAAAQKYIAANYATLKSNTSSGAVESATVAELASFLPEGFDDQNSYLQKTCVLIRKGSGPERLDALVVGYGGREIPDRSIASVAMNAGQGAGYIPSTDTAVARGPSWSLNTTPFRPGRCGGAEPLTGGSADAGHLVTNLFYEGPGNLMTDFLYRDEVPGHAELNTMNVPLQMANAGLVILGDTCTQTALALESTSKDVVVCDGAGGKWRYSNSSWKDPVADWGELSIMPGNNGDVRVTRDTGRAFVRNGGSWVAMAVDQNGDMIVPEEVRSRDMTATGRIHSDGTIYARGHIQTEQDMNVGLNLRVSRNAWVNRDLQVDQNVQVGQDVQIGRDARVERDVHVTRNVFAEGVATSATKGWMATPGIEVGYDLAKAGDGCHFQTPQGVQFPIGTIVRDTIGRLLICQYPPQLGVHVFLYANGTMSP